MAGMSFKGIDFVMGGITDDKGVLMMFGRKSRDFSHGMDRPL